MKKMMTMAAVAALGTLIPAAAEACQYSNKPVLSEATLEALRLSTPSPRLLRQTDQAKAEASATSITGLWKVTVLVNRQPVDQAYEIYHEDGTEVLIDQTPPQMGNVCLGVYEEVSLRVYSLTHPFWVFDSTGNLTGSGMITSTVMMSKDGATFSGSSTEDVFDLKGKQLSHTTANIEGTRIRP